jgi:hypothetical protein
MKYLLNLQARVPLVFETLAGVIAYIRQMNPLWFMLEELRDESWEVMIYSNNSRVSVASYNDPGKPAEDWIE